MQISCPDCRGRLTGGEPTVEQRVYVAVCDECGKRFRVYFNVDSRIAIEPLLETVERPESLAETFPECKLDLPAMLRDSMLTDVRCHGHAERCPTQMSSIFADFDHEQIERWCNTHNLSIIARADGRIIICPATANNLRMHGITAPNMQELARQHEARIRAEVEAMDWLEVIDA
jgi:hypothetical protein